jgi:hypothetical protein
MMALLINENLSRNRRANGGFLFGRLLLLLELMVRLQPEDLPTRTCASTRFGLEHPSLYLIAQLCTSSVQILDVLPAVHW